MKTSLFRLSPLLALVFLLLWLRTCREGLRQAERYEDNLSAKEAVLSSTRLSNGQLAHEKGLLEVSLEELKAQLRSMDDSMKLLLRQVKEPVVAIRWHTRYLRDTLYLPFETPVKQQFRSAFSFSEEWLSLSGSIDSSGMRLEQIAIPNTQRLVVGYRKGRPLVTVTNSNPYLITENLEGAVVPLRRKYWVMGIGGTWNIYEPPGVGIFVGFKILEF